MIWTSRHIDPRAGIAYAILVLVLVWGTPGAAQEAQWGHEFPYEFSRPAPSEVEDDSGPPVAEPFFAWLIHLTETDTLGTWSAEEIQSTLGQWPGTSRFPVETLVRLERRRPSEAEQFSWPHAAVRAVWEMTLTEDLERSMPYSILGYHPGTLRLSRHLLLTEVRKGTLAYADGADPHLMRDVIMFRLDQGYLVLDVDGLVDRLLGKSLDDSGTVGFVLAREEGRLLGLAVSLGRSGRRIYGEFDFRQDKVLPNGRPAARGLSAACRMKMLEDYTGPELGRWVDGR